MKKLGAQLYTVRGMLKTDSEIRSTLAAIKNIGYDFVQLFGSVELAESCARIAKETGLEIIGILSDLGSYENNEKELFDMCSRYDVKDIGIYTDFSECQNIGDLINRTNTFAQKAARMGFTFSYHNHGHEFIKLDCGEIPMNCLLERFDAKTVDFMPDTYWIHDGGYDVRYFLERTRGRVKILHLKDMIRTEQGHTFAEVGNGNLYFKGIMETALDCGIEIFVVEQDSCPGDPIDSLRQSYSFTKTLLEA